MGVSFDYASSLLRCPEDSNSILGLSEEEQDFRGETERRDLCRSFRQRCDFYSGQLVDFTLQSEEYIASLIERESHHLPPKDYAEKLLKGKLDLTIRSDSIDWILKVGQEVHDWIDVKSDRMPFLMSKDSLHSQFFRPLFL